MSTVRPTPDIICARPRKCVTCGRNSSKLCDYPIGDGKTCDTPMCAEHTWSPERDKDYCKPHKAKMIEPAIREKIKAEREANKRDGLIFIAHSKYPGRCRDKDCGAQWEECDPCYWDKGTREVFCVDCGEQMQ